MRLWTLLSLLIYLQTIYPQTGCHSVPCKSGNGIGVHHNSEQEKDDNVEKMSDTKIQIRIRAENLDYYLGGPIGVTISYVNVSDSSLSFRDPDRTWEVRLQVTHNPDSQMKGEQKEAPFGRIFFHRRSDGLERQTVEDADTITLAPNQEYQFQEDVGTRWPELFIPGINLIHIKDYSRDEAPLLSNPVQLNVVYDEHTFPMLLHIAGNENSTVDAHLFAVDWIRKLYPAFALTADPASEQYTEEIRNQIAQARAWWKAHKDDADVRRKLIRAIHTKLP